VSGIVIVTSAAITAAGLRIEDVDWRCRADRVTLEVAVEAFTASKDRPPDSEAELVDAGFLRAESAMYDLRGSTVVVAPGSRCAANLTGGQEVRDAAAPDMSESTTGAGGSGTERPEECLAVDAAFERLDRVDGDSAAELSADLYEVATMIRDGRDSAQDPGVRADIVGMADVMSGMAQIVGQLDAHSTAVDTETLATIDALSAAMADYVRVLPTSEVMTTLAPDLAATCGTGFVPMSELLSAVEGMQRALTAFLATDLGHEPEFVMLIEMSESMGSPDEPLRPRSTMVDEFDDCNADLEAASLGDNEGCDALYHACGNGYMAACDDLFLASFPGTDYSAVGASCGGRAQPLGRGYAGHCEEVDD
jgi:hypothetical protein